MVYDQLVVCVEISMTILYGIVPEIKLLSDHSQWAKAFYTQQEGSNFLNPLAEIY